MTRMPRDVKSAKGPGSSASQPPMQTTNPFPNPILETGPENEHEEHPLPPYSEEDTASQTRDAPGPAGGEERQAQVARVPESNAVNASSEVHITGPLHVLG